MGRIRGVGAETRRLMPEAGAKMRAVGQIQGMTLKPGAGAKGWLEQEAKLGATRHLYIDDNYPGAKPGGLT